MRKWRRKKEKIQRVELNVLKIQEGWIGEKAPCFWFWLLTVKPSHYKSFVYSSNVVGIYR